MPRPTEATIHIDAMRQNIAVARARAGASKFWAVVKANGYGHGVERAMRGFVDADGLALNDLNAALRLRELGWNKPILLLQGVFESCDLEAAFASNLHLVVHSIEQIEMIEKTPGGPASLDVYLKVNTGMNRLGFLPDQAPGAFARLRAATSVRNIVVMTHFANSFALAPEAPAVSVTHQRSQLDALANAFGCQRSFADSATLLKNADSLGDWCRLGVMLYGMTMLPGRKASEFDLLPAMTLSSKIIGVQHLAVGDSVGYGSRFVASEPIRIGIVGCGYTDGYPRSADDGTPILVDGVKTRVVGRVSMDSITVDLSRIPDAGVGSNVTLWGRGLPIEEVAACAQTIGCELMCGLRPGVRVVETLPERTLSESLDFSN